jgi:hypothetical protein
MALDFANIEGYELQPKKSIAIHIRGNNKQCETTNEKLMVQAFNNSPRFVLNSGVVHTPEQM